MRLQLRSWQAAVVLLLLLATGCGSTVRVALKPFYSPADLDPQAAEVRLDVPLTRYDTLLTFRYQASWADIVDDAFSALDIQSESEPAAKVSVGNVHV